MNDETFRSRLLKLVQKSRKALRLYSSMGKRSGDLADVQVKEWREVNSDLLKSLSIILDSPSNKGLASSVIAIRDRFYHEWRMAEGEMHKKHKELLRYAESGDFLRVVNLGTDLASLKARVQALQAAHHEIQEVVNRSHVSQPPIELSKDVPAEEVVAVESDPNPIQRTAKVIPLRQRAR